jgi:hypothetical protein
MGMSTPALRLRKPSATSFAHILANLHRQGKPIPPKWLDSTIRNERLFSTLALSAKYGPIEREIECALYDFHKITKAGKFPVQKLLENSKRVVFTFTNAAIDAVTVKALYQQLQQKIAQRNKGIELTLTPQQFAEIRPSITHLMYLHGNQTLTGAPYFIGGVPHVFFFQWGNLLGVARYTAAPSEKVVPDLLIYFEDLEERTLEEAMQEYQKQHPQFIKTITAPELIMPQPTPAPRAIYAPDQHIHVPTFSLRPTPFRC